MVMKLKKMPGPTGAVEPVKKVNVKWQFDCECSVGKDMDEL
jgi:hypothetical protein